MLENKTIVITGVSSGIGAETAKVIKSQGATVIGVDRNETSENVDRFVHMDLMNQESIDNGINAIGGDIDALCNIAGLPPTAGRVPTLTVNFVALRYLTENMIGNLNDGASIVNAASLAGFGWPEQVEACKDFISNGNFDNVEELCERNNVDDPRSYFYSKEILIIWTMLNRWTWRDRGIRMNTISPGPVETPILPDFLETLGERAEEDMKVNDRAGLPSDIAPVFAFMCSDGSAWFRGTDMLVNGGMSSHILEGMHNLTLD
jgi:NAD(P)-dependent dehydrogenase (short-subunit alcohol dehydrogenase family)